MLTIEELISGEIDAISSATRTFDEESLTLTRVGPEGDTAYDIFLASLETLSEEL